MRQSDTESTYRGPAVPRAVGEQLRVALGLDARPRTLGDWVDALANMADRDGIDLTMDVLCTAESSPHAARFDGETHHYRCVLDPLIVPFLADGVDEVEVETRSPVDDEVIEIAVTGAGVDVHPSEAVFSFGVDATVDGPPDDGVSPAFAYGTFCPYGNAFASREEYEQWAAEVDAVTMATDVEAAVGWARAIGRLAD